MIPATPTIQIPVLGQAELNHVLKRATVDAHGPHGIAHWLSVLEIAGWLCVRMDGVALDVVSWFAVLHDSMRVRIGSDDEHGVRAAELADKLLNDGVLVLPPARFAVLRTALSMHSLGMVDDDPTVGVCWDADRLDCERLGYSPQLGRLSTDAARKLFLSGEHV